MNASQVKLNGVKCPKLDIVILFLDDSSGTGSSEEIITNSTEETPPEGSGESEDFLNEALKLLILPNWQHKVVELQHNGQVEL